MYLYFIILAVLGYCELSFLDEYFQKKGYICEYQTSCASIERLKDIQSIEHEKLKLGMNLIKIKDSQNQISYIWVRLSKKENIIVAKRDLKKDQVIQEQDIEITQKIIEKEKEYITSPKEAVGKIIKKPLKKGEILLNSHLSQKPLVKIGQEVKVVYKKNGLLITTKGIALEKATQEGSLIRVKVKDKVIKGEVTEESTVSVEQ